MKLVKISITILFAFLVAPLYASDFETAEQHRENGDYAAALEIYQELADDGDAQAQYRMGQLYDGGKGVEQDYTKAAEWFLKAAEQGHAWAEYSIGDMYQNGDGVPKNDVEALKWFLKSAAQGNAWAQNSVGFMYDTGRGGIKQSYSEAVKWYRLAAKQGSVLAQRNLGVMYDEGYGTPANDVLAYMWYHIAVLNDGSYERAYLDRSDLSGRITNEEVATAEALAQICLNSGYQDCGE